MNASGKESTAVGVLCARAACDWCMKPRMKGVVLKRCTGCAVAWYCSKECQAAAWPSHKRLCTSRSRTEVPPVYKDLGYTTLAAVADAGKSWALAHNPTIIMIGNAIVELRGGVDAVLSEPRALVFDLKPPPPHIHERGPSAAFVVDAVRLRHQDRLDNVQSQWTAAVVKHREAATRIVQRTNPDPRFAGIVPIMFYLGGTPLDYQGAFPLFRPRPQVREDAGPAIDRDDERTTPALKALVKLCVGFIMNQGIVLRIPSDAGKVVPHMGWLVRRKKKWEWKPAGAPQAQAWAKLAEITRLHEQGLSPLDVFTIYDRLWPSKVE